MEQDGLPSIINNVDDNREDFHCKIIYAIRHAESTKNEDKREFSGVVESLKTYFILISIILFLKKSRMKLPSTKQLKKSVGILKYNTDPVLSIRGNAQIRDVSHILRSENFLKENKVV